MRTAYLTDSESVGGGMEYIRRRAASLAPGDEARVFASSRGECTAKRINEWNADIIHVNHLRSLVQLFLANPLVKPRGKVTFTVHGIHLRKYDFLPRTPANRLRRALRLALERHLYRRCDAIIALTKADATEIRRLYGKTLPIVVEPNTVEKGEFTPPDMPLRYGADEFAFVCIARFDFQKGQDVLVDAIAHAQDTLRARACRTLFIGGGSTLDAIRRQVSAHGVSDLVVFAGEIANAGIYMTVGRTLVSPSRWEGMPYLLLEAAERARPVIASDCAGNREALAGHSQARFFPVGDSARLATLLTEHAQ